MHRKTCIVCGNPMERPALCDPSICRSCEHDTVISRVGRYYQVDLA